MNKYEEIAKQIHAEVEAQLGQPIKIDRYRTSPWSGCAWKKSLTVQVPRPVSDIALDTYLHELAHLICDHKLSCMREYMATQFSITTFKRFGLRISKKLRRHHNWYIAYSLAQALNRNLKHIPHELKPYKRFLARITCFGDSMKIVGYTYRADYSKC